LAILVAAVFAPTFVQATDYAVGVKAGDWIKYDITATWTGNGTQPSYVTETNKVEWIRIDVSSVAGTTVGLNETVQYNNGTQTFQSYDTDVQGSISSPFVAASNLTAGDPLSPQNPETTINQTVTRMYAGANRNVNIIESTSSSQSYVSEGRIYFDKSTGIMVELYMNQTDYDNPGGYVETSVKATETNLWSANTFDVIQNNLIYIVASAAAIIIILATTIALRKRKPPALEQPPPASVPPPPPP